MTELEQLDADLDFLYERRRQLIAAPRLLDSDPRNSRAADLHEVTELIDKTEKKRRKAIRWDNKHPRRPTLP
ncbi:hypothetical protein [Arthrobacter sp. A2-55]|uniref:hypothetical protein n=1 Tax=Arthrobacter sp. A2-55 TaxID=2897337 RepID=UPI0021CDC79A|nr:hypothetical protein [Arthrobacter sp. A2-55]MCU6480497.1 hypothetical protein [Arthrobacter sp. A2-55]